MIMALLVFGKYLLKCFKVQAFLVMAVTADMFYNTRIFVMALTADVFSNTAIIFMAVAPDVFYNASVVCHGSNPRHVL